MKPEGVEHGSLQNTCRSLHAYAQRRREPEAQLQVMPRDEEMEQRRAVRAVQYRIKINGLLLDRLHGIRPT